jgi:hypothetical protein
MSAAAMRSTIQSLTVGCCVGMALAVLPAAYQGELFAWHPLLLTLGFLGFVTEGIMVAVSFRPKEGMTRVTAITNHALIQAAATAFLTLGFYAIYHNKVRLPGHLALRLRCLVPGCLHCWLAQCSGRPSACHLLTHLPCPARSPSLPTPTQNLKGKHHFTSLHGKVGLLTFVLALASPALGMLSFRRLGLIQRFPEDWQPRLKWLHRLVSELQKKGRAGQAGRGWSRAGQGRAGPAIAAPGSSITCRDLGSVLAVVVFRRCLPMRMCWAWLRCSCRCPTQRSLLASGAASGRCACLCLVGKAGVCALKAFEVRCGSSAGRPAGRPAAAQTAHPI